MNKILKVIHLPSTVGGNPQGISRHLNLLNVNSQSWAISQNYLGYPSDKVLVNNDDNIITAEFRKILALRYVFITDVAFFNFGTGLFNPYPNIYPKNQFFGGLIFFYKYYSRVMALLEVGLLKFLGRLIFIQYQGDDARQGDFCRINFNISPAQNVDDRYYRYGSDENKRKSICFYAKYSTEIYSLNPDLMRVLPGNAKFLPYSHISLVEWRPFYTQLIERPIRICHAPSHRAFKGTDLIIEALDALRIKGYSFELVLVEGLSNSEAKEVYKDVDVLVDQLFAGWYGGLAVEAMALGKPVVAYIREEDLHFIPAQMRLDLPIIQSEPNTIREVLETILNMPRVELFEIARRSRAYVEKWHDPIKIAERIKADMVLALANKT